MKRLMLLSILCLPFIVTKSQSLKKYPISNSGASIYMLCDVKGFTFDYSDDSSYVYTGECINSDVLYGVICVKLKEPVPEISKAQNLMIDYLNFIKADFSILDSTGYGYGHQLKGYDKAVGVIDYWKDSEQKSWKVKAWTDGNFIAVLYANSSKELPEPKVNLFLDGFRFPGMK